jgi:hypothetical protein
MMSWGGARFASTREDFDQIKFASMTSVLLNDCGTFWA